jgi:putative peptide zinc metalloprotease protein
VWLLFSFVAFFHESAHGCTVKHYGGGVHSMGFMLMYFLPCFFCDSTEVYVYGEKWARIYTALAGIWSELIFCSFVTIVWWATSPGHWLHNLAYLLIVITGIGVVILNINPLVKLDGYFIFTELIGVTDLKEKSTAYLSTWCKRHICGLPVEVEYVPRQRRPLFVIYGLASGTYSYVLLFVIVEITYNVAYKFSPDWAWLPALLLGLKVFQSRIVAAGRFMKVFYLDKKERVSVWLSPARLVAVTAIALFVMFAPVWPDSVAGRVSVEPAQRAVVRAEVGGFVEDVLAHEGMTVAAGAPLVRLRNMGLESEKARTQADLSVATARANQAALQYASFGAANRERQQLAERNLTLGDEVKKLNVVSPLAGVVVTPRLQDLLGSYLKEGTEVAEVQSQSSARVRIFIPEIAMRNLRVGERADVKLDAAFWPMRGKVVAIAAATEALPEGLMAKEKYYQGFRPPQYYAATIELPSNEHLREGMPGTGQILVGRKSLAGFAWRLVHDAVALKLW